ncbi:MAG: outer membrane protein assembly factor BamA [Nitrospirota bacterium]
MMRETTAIRPCASFAFKIAAIFVLIASFTGSAGAVVERIDVEGLYSISREELLMLLDLKPGDRIDPLRVRNGIKRAFLKGVFEDIKVVTEDEEGYLIKIAVREREVINKISISGNLYFSDKKIKDYFPMKEGENMRHDLIEGSIRHLKSALSEMGFSKAEVKTSLEKTDRYRVTLNLHIVEGEPVTIQELTLYGVPEADIIGFIKTDQGDVYDRSVLKQDIEAIKKHYIREGYLRPVVNYTFSGGKLDLEVRPGKKLVVTFEGNTVFSSKALLKEMPFSEAGDLRDDLIDEADRRVVSLYHSKGYLSAQAAPVRSDTETETVEVHFFIFEGERVIVSSIEFLGAGLKDKDLKEVMALKEGVVYRQEVLSSDIDNLREFYIALGYIYVKIHEPVVRIENQLAKVRITIEEGIQVVVDEVVIEGVKSIPYERVEKAVNIQKGSLYNEVDISNTRYRIIDIYTDNGFIDADVDVKGRINGNNAQITFSIKEGAVTFFGKTVITGNKRTKTEVLERELQFKESGPFSYSLMTRQRQRLYKLGLFTDVTIEPLERQNDKRDVRVSVAEGNAGAVEFGIGYGDYDKYRGFLDISYRNLFGMNRQISLRVEHSSIEDRFMLSYYEPWFLKMQVPFRALLMKEEKTEKNIDTGEVNYKINRYTATAGIEKKLSSNIKGVLYYEFSIVKTYDVKPDVILSREDTGTLAISGISPGLIYDTRDNPFDPKKGLLMGVSMKLASGLLFSGTDFIKVVANGSYYKEISARHVFAASVRVGAAQGFGSTRGLPLVERFFLGGRSTVRGYNQDTLGPKGSDGTPTGGNAFFMANIEMRTYLGRGIGLVTFIDSGNVWVKASDIRPSLKHTAGIGLRYSTPVGPLRIDYGYKLSREAGEGIGALHFSIGHAF